MTGTFCCGMIDGGYITSTLTRSTSSCLRRAESGGIDFRPLVNPQSESGDVELEFYGMGKPFFVGYPVEKFIPRIGDRPLPASLSVFLSS